MMLLLEITAGSRFDVLLTPRNMRGMQDIPTWEHDLFLLFDGNICKMSASQGKFFQLPRNFGSGALAAPQTGKKMCVSEFQKCLLDFLRLGTQRSP